ncbi:hypothetical protein CBL_07596 [Carabus blaptoides fortunei]
MDVPLSLCGAPREVEIVLRERVELSEKRHRSWPQQKLAGTDTSPSTGLFLFAYSCRAWTEVLKSQLRNIVL